MADWAEKAKQKRRNRNRWVTVALIYFMFITLFASITLGENAFGGDSSSRLIAAIVLGVISVIYWIAFFIIIRRNNQRGDK